MAIVSSRSGVGKPGYYTFVYDDSPEQKLLAMFTPSGHNCCYHGNGVVHFLTSETGGTMAENNGAISKRWNWPNHGSKLPVTITFHVSTYLFLCVCVCVCVWFVCICVVCVYICVCVCIGETEREREREREKNTESDRKK